MSGKTRRDPNIYWSVGYCQSDYASFEGTYDYKADACLKLREINNDDTWEPLRIAQALARIQCENAFGLRATMYSGLPRLHVDRGLGPAQRGSRDGEAYSEIEELMRDLARYLYSSCATSPTTCTRTRRSTRASRPTSTTSTRRATAMTEALRLRADLRRHNARSVDAWVKAPHVKAWGFLSDHPGPNGGNFTPIHTDPACTAIELGSPRRPVRCRGRGSATCAENSTELPDEVCIALAKFALLPVSRSNSDD
jgi:hypothetical protein